MIEEQVKELLRELEPGNCFGEPITLVAATKTRTADEINLALKAGITDIGENKVQEFRDKYDLVSGGRRHFIGHLQTNKVKYLIGKTFLVHSVDRDELAETLALLSFRAGVTTDILVQINIGKEETKGGYPPEEGYSAYLRLKELQGLRVKGFMAMLPPSEDEGLLGELADRMRALYEQAKSADREIEYLSMGMSGDWKLCLAHGSNMIRLGTAIFGERNYKTPTLDPNDR